MEYWLSKNLKDKLQLPINPESIGAQRSTNHEDIVLANGDEKTILSGKNLRTTTITSFFPANQTYFQEVDNILTPKQYVEKIEKWIEEQAILLFQVTGTKMSMDVTIRSFDWEEVGGAVGDINYTLELKEFEPITYHVVGEKLKKWKSAINKQVAPAQKANNTGDTSSKKTRTHIVVKGDSLWKISKKYYKDGAQWKKIYNANIKVIGKNPNLIKPGQKLVIP